MLRCAGHHGEGVTEASLGEGGGWGGSKIGPGGREGEGDSAIGIYLTKHSCHTCVYVKQEDGGGDYGNTSGLAPSNGGET